MELEIISAFQNFLSDERIYEPSEISEMLKTARHWFRFDYKNRNLKYFNVPMSLDIETTSFYNNGEKNAIMYEWTLGIFGLVMIGRKWEELLNVLDYISRELQLTAKKRIIIYIHNMQFEFQFLRKWLEWQKVFAIETRQPVYAIAENNIEFRCSYILSGYSLEKVGEHLQNFKIAKKTGDLDYSLMRHSETPLTDKEKGYCINDVRVVMAYIMESIISSGGITKLPLTKTGYVREYCRNCCFNDPDNPKDRLKSMRYHEIMKYLIIQPEEYMQLKRAFQGGFTHANAFCTDRIIIDVDSFDFTSSYPAVMIAEEYPMSSAEIIDHSQTKEEFENNLKYYCCLFDIEFYDLEPELWQENYISLSRCYEHKNVTVNNGRIVRADYIKTTITEVDYMIIKKFYKWRGIRISNFRRYRKGYLPTDFIKAIIKLYKDKTELKGVEGNEAEYLNAKEMLNSCYGMSVTDICREINEYGSDWIEPYNPDIEKELKKYNKNYKRFLYYPWGVWVTAYARRNLFTGIIACGSDYCYSDTDSIKITHANKHMDYINRYNTMITEALHRAADYHGIPYEDLSPKTVKGVSKPLGVWDFDGHYKRFKTLGAKRYMVEDKNGNINITVAGLNKKAAVPYLCRPGKDPFERFTDKLYVPAEYTGKNTHTYLDFEQQGYIRDYLGNIAPYYEKTSVHLEAADYSLSLSRDYVDFILDIRRFRG